MPAYSGNRIDPNLTPSNIKDGVSIFGVDGTFVSGSGSDFGLGANEIFRTPTKHINTSDDFGYSSRATGCFEDVNYIYFCGVIQFADLSDDSVYGHYSVVRFEKSTGNKDLYETAFGGSGNRGIKFIGVNGDDIIFCRTPDPGWNSFSTTSLTFSGSGNGFSSGIGVELSYNGFNVFTGSTTYVPAIYYFNTMPPAITNITGGTVVFNGDTYLYRSIVTRINGSNTNTYTIRFAIFKY